MPENRDWIKPTILLCSFGFITYVKPSTPYLTPFLLGPHKNLTVEELVNEIYPVWSYSFTGFLIPVFLLTDYLRYKPLITLQGLASIACWCLLVFATGVPLMKLMQVFYGLSTACQIGYYSYIYSVVDEEHYQKATAYVRTSTQMGFFFGSVLSQILVSVADIDYLYLNVMTLVNVTIGFVISLFLPLPERSMYFYKRGATSDEAPSKNDSTPSSVDDTPSENSSFLSKWKLVLYQLWIDLKQCYSTGSLLRWSIWWAFSTCGWILVVSYIQNLWETILPSEDHESELYNGAVEALSQILGAGAAFAVGFLNINWEKWGELVLGFGSILECGLLLVMYSTDNIWVCYAAYILFNGLYNFVITISQFRIAVGLSSERFALVFGLNTFLAVVLTSVITLVVVDSAGLGLDVTTQFMVYSGYFGIIAFAYLSHAFYDICKRHCRNQEEIQDDREMIIEEDHL